jgi:hypothetical protein
MLNALYRLGAGAGHAVQATGNLAGQAFQAASNLTSQAAGAVNIFGHLNATVAGLPQVAMDATKLTLLKESAKLIINFLKEAETKTSEEIKADTANGLQDLFDCNEELDTLVHNPTSTKEAINSKITELYTSLERAELTIHGFSINARASIEAPSEEEIDDLINSSDAASEVSLNADEQKVEINTLVSRLGICLRRKAEVTAIFGNTIPQELLKLINSDDEKAYYNCFSSEIANKVNENNTLSFLQPIARLGLHIRKFFAGLFAGFLAAKVTNLLKSSLNALDVKNPAELMDFISSAFIKGLLTYNNAVINAAGDIRKKFNDGELKGCVDSELEKILSKNELLHGGFSTSKEFYEKLFDKVLANTFSWSISRFVVKKLTSWSGILNDPMKHIEKPIRDANSFQYHVDKAIIDLITPILSDLNKKPSDGEVTAEISIERSYSAMNKQTLSHAIKTLLKAVDINSSSDATEVGAVLEKKPALLSADTLVSQTAEVGALIVLESLQKQINADFVRKQSINILRTINNSFSADSTPITERQIKQTEKQRQTLLENLTKVIIVKSVDGLPLLNSKKLNDDMNRGLNAIKTHAQKTRDGLKNLFIGAEGNEIARETPFADFKAHFATLSDERKKLNDQIETLIDKTPFTEAQRDNLNLALKTYNRCFKNVIEAAKKEGKPDLNKALGEFQADIAGPVFAQKADASLMNIDIIKKIAKAGLGFLLTDKFNKAYTFACDAKTIKYLGVHQTLGAILKV